MNEIIKLPDLEAVQEFVRSAEGIGESVLVSKEGFKNQFDGTSIISMLCVIGERLKVEYMSDSVSFNKILKKYISK